MGDPDAVAGMDADGAGDGFVVFERAVRGVEVFQGGDAVFFDKQGVSFADGGVGEDDVGRGQSSDRERCFPDRVAAAFFVFLVQDQDSHALFIPLFLNLSFSPGVRQMQRKNRARPGAD